MSPPLEFIFCIGDVPVRFFHGDADHLGAHLFVSELQRWSTCNSILPLGIAARTWMAYRRRIRRGGPHGQGGADWVKPLGGHHVRLRIPPLRDTVAFLDPLEVHNSPRSGAPRSCSIPTTNRRFKGRR